jgi:rubrerythrin
MTEQHLINAFGGESQAHMRYLHFANQADKEKFLNVARLFRAVAHAEYVHVNALCAEPQRKNSRHSAELLSVLST